MVKLFRGLDFTDELQYYGQILSLIKNNKLFEEDLFIQQFVYIFYLPLFKLFQWLNPDLNGLILFGRICLLCTVLVSYFIIRKLTILYSRSSCYFAFTCISIVVSSKILAISYGSVSLILSTLIIALYLSDIHSIKKNIYASFLCVILCFTHPSFGICMTSLWAASYSIEKQKGFIFFIIVFGAFSCLIFGFLFSTNYLLLDDFLKALKFSSQYNNAIILKINKDMQALGIYWILSTAITFFINFRKSNVHKFKIITDDKYFIIFTLTIAVAFTFYFWNSFSFLYSYLFYFISIFISFTFCPKNDKYASLFKITLVRNFYWHHTRNNKWKRSTSFLSRNYRIYSISSPTSY